VSTGIVLHEFIISEQPPPSVTLRDGSFDDEKTRPGPELGDHDVARAYASATPDDQGVSRVQRRDHRGSPDEHGEQW
jgi:hypothetical protein